MLYFIFPPQAGTELLKLMVFVESVHLLRYIRFYFKFNRIKQYSSIIVKLKKMVSIFDMLFFKEIF